MPPKPISQLTQDEEKLIIVATKMLEALHVQVAWPPATPLCRHIGMNAFVRSW